jgi:hypothetical protein
VKVGWRGLRTWLSSQGCEDGVGESCTQRSMQALMRSLVVPHSAPHVSPRLRGEPSSRSPPRVKLRGLPLTLSALRSRALHGEGVHAR